MKFILIIELVLFMKLGDNDVANFFSSVVLIRRTFKRISRICPLKMFRIYLMKIIRIYLRKFVKHFYISIDFTLIMIGIWKQMTILLLSSKIFSDFSFPNWSKMIDFLSLSLEEKAKSMFRLVNIRCHYYMDIDFVKIIMWVVVLVTW